VMQRWTSASVAARIAVSISAVVILGSCCALAAVLGYVAGRGVGLVSTTHAATSTSTSATGTHVAQATSRPKAWVTVQRYSGNGIAKTAPFTVTAAQWKITWACDPAAYGSSYNLIADLTVPGAALGDTVVNVICTQQDANTQRGETMEYTPGTFYLDVNSEASWVFQIQVFE
jgi:hypothetical protein